MECDALKTRHPIVAFNFDFHPVAGLWSINHESPTSTGHIKGSHYRGKVRCLMEPMGHWFDLVPGAGLEPATFGCLRHRKGFARHTIAIKAAL